MNSPQLLALNDDEFEGMRRLVLELAGINLSDSKRQLVKRRFAPRLRALGCGSFREYLDYFQHHRDEEQTSFCNAITTNLTAFFREKHHFDFLEREALPALLRRNAATRRLRLWSAGCSTGEEAYSLAAVLHKFRRELAHWDVRILATDLDENCLATGAEGLYPTGDLQRHLGSRLGELFESVECEQRGQRLHYWRARPVLKQQIVFRKLNLIEPWPMKGKFDVIFCRNVFIYFNRLTQQRIVSRFTAAQDAGGYLCLGHSETLTDQPACRYRLREKTLYVRE